MSIEETESPLDTLSHENEISEKLVERLAEAGQSLHTANPVPPGEIAEGLRLLAQYRRLHADRFGELRPEAHKVAMPACFEHLDEVERNQHAAGGLVRRAVDALGDYERGTEGGRAGLEAALDELTQTEYDAIHYENDYPLSCLRSALPETAASRVKEGYDRTRIAASDLERHVRQHLDRTLHHASTPFVVRCHSPGCSEAGQAETFPAENGYLGIRAPKGWTSLAHPPRSLEVGGVELNVDFYCPHHAPPDSVRRREATRGETQSAAREKPASGDSDDAPGVCSCCDPVPGNLA